MKFVCDGLDLCDAVLKVVKAASAKSTNPLLEGIKLEAYEDCLKLTATDLEISLEKKIRADVKIAGAAVVTGKYFADFVRKLTDEQIELVLSDRRQLRISYMDSEGFLQCLPADDFPRIERVESERSLSIVEKDLKDLIHKSIFAVATDDSRPVLKGVLFEIDEYELTAVALDGFRISCIKKGLESNAGKFSIVIPARALGEMLKMISDSEDTVATVKVSKNYLMLELSHTTLISRLIEGEFIKYRQIIPQEFTSEITVKKDLLADGIERAAVLSNNPKNNLVKFDIREKLLTLTSNSEIGNIKENIAVALKGKDILIAFNARYFTEALKVINDDYVRISFNSPVAPCVMKAANADDSLFLILPVRLVG